MGPNRAAKTLIIGKPLSWIAENRQDLAEGQRVKVLQAEGRIQTKGKTQGTPIELERRAREGKKWKMMWKMRLEVVKESLHSFVVHSFYKHLLIIMIR